MSDVKHPMDELAAFNQRYRAVECVGEWLIYFAGLHATGSGAATGAWIASRGVNQSSTVLEREHVWVTAIFGRQIWAEDLITRQGLRELEHVTTEAKDRLLAAIARK